MEQHLSLMRRVLRDGVYQTNRTGIRTIFLPGEMMKFDLREGFPVVTTRKAAWKSAIGEMIAFIRAETTLEGFHRLGCKFWDDNAKAPYWLSNPNNRAPGSDLGEIYGHQWRKFRMSCGSVLDQLVEVLHQIIYTPESRRMVVSAWRPDRFYHMALPPCHVMFQFIANVQKNELHMTLYMRSNDLFLGAPANIVGYAFLLQAIAHATGYEAATFTYFIGDAHIYENHVEVVSEQLCRKPYGAPKLVFKKPYQGPGDTYGILDWLEGLHPDDFELDGYEHHPKLSASMAV